MAAVVQQRIALEGDKETEKENATDTLLDKSAEVTRLADQLNLRDGVILGALFALGAVFLVCLSIVPQAAFDLTFSKGPPMFEDQYDPFAVQGLLHYASKAGAVLIWLLVFVVVAIIPPTVFAMYAAIIWYPMTESTRGWLEFIALHNCRGMFSYSFSFYMAYDGITVDCNYKDITINHIQGQPEMGIFFVYAYCVSMCALGTYIHFLHYTHHTDAKRDRYSYVLSFFAFIFLFLGFSIPYGKSEFSGYLSGYCTEGEEFVWFNFVSEYPANDYYSDWWKFYLTFSYLLFFVLIPIMNVILMTAHSLYPGNPTIYKYQYAFAQFYPLDYCVLKYFLVSFEYGTLTKQMIDDLYGDLCNDVATLDRTDGTCFQEDWLLRIGLLMLLIHVCFYWGTEYSLWRARSQEEYEELKDGDTKLVYASAGSKNIQDEQL